MHLINLTRNHDNLAIYINADQIESIQVARNSTCIHFAGDNGDHNEFVKETPEEIAKLIHGQTPPP